MPNAAVAGHAEGDAPRTCQACGYALCALPEPRCPECGTPYDPEDPTTFRTRRYSPHLAEVGDTLRTGLLAWVAGLALVSLALCTLAQSRAVEYFVAIIGSAFAAGATISLFLLGLAQRPPPRPRRTLAIVALYSLALTTWLTHWPAIAMFALHRPALERAARQLAAGRALATPARIGVYVIHQAGLNKAGLPYFWTDPDPSGPTGFVWCPPGVRPHSEYNISTSHRVGGGWYLITED